MSPEEVNAQKEIFQFLKDTGEIYNMCKKYSILIEEILPKQKAPIHAANELKALVFHFYNASQYPTDIKTNILEAKEHLCRAFYDLHSLIVSIYIQQIVNKLIPYTSATIANAFPEYGNTIRPAVKEIQEKLRELRTNRNTDVSIINANISDFELQVTNLARFDDIVESMKPELNKYEVENKARDIGKLFRNIIVILFVAAVFFGIGYYWANLKHRNVEINKGQIGK